MHHETLFPVKRGVVKVLEVGLYELVGCRAGDEGKAVAIAQRVAQVLDGEARLHGEPLRLTLNVGYHEIVRSLALLRVGMPCASWLIAAERQRLLALDVLELNRVAVPHDGAQAALKQELIVLLLRGHVFSELLHRFAVVSGL